jgi:hypothetical protein
MKGRGGVAGGDVDGDASTARVVGRDDGTFGGREHAMGCITVEDLWVSVTAAAHRS